jgi:hypothetical protein
LEPQLHFLARNLLQLTAYFLKHTHQNHLLTCQAFAGCAFKLQQPVTVMHKLITISPNTRVACTQQTRQLALNTVSIHQAHSLPKQKKRGKNAGESEKYPTKYPTKPRMSYLGGLLYHFMMAQGFLSFLVCFLVELRICLLFMLEFQMILWPVKKTFP